MTKILVMLLTGKENINAEMVSFNFAINAIKNAKGTVEFILLGSGVKAANRNQKSSPQFLEQIEKIMKARIPIKICKVSMASEGLTDNDIFPDIEMVLGGVEVSARIEEGYSVLTF